MNPYGSVLTVDGRVLVATGVAAPKRGSQVIQRPRSVGDPNPPAPRTTADPDDGIDLHIATAPLFAVDGWLMAHDLVRLYPVPWPQICAWIRRGLIEAAIEVGSPARRYRPRDLPTLIRELDLLTSEHKR